MPQPQEQPGPVQWPQHPARVDECNIIEGPRARLAKIEQIASFVYKKNANESGLLKKGGSSPLNISNLFTHPCK